MSRILGLLFSLSALVGGTFLLLPDRTARAAGPENHHRNPVSLAAPAPSGGPQSSVSKKSGPDRHSLERLIPPGEVPALTVDLGPLRLVESLRPNQIGIGRDVSFDATAFQPVGHTGSELVEALVVRSYAAAALRLRFEKVAMAAGETLVVYGGRGEGVPTAYTGRGPFGDGQFWTDTLAGDTAVIEWRRPVGRAHPESSVTISGISHLVEQPAAGLNAVGACEIDARCGTQVTVRNSAARIIFTSNGQTFACSGTILATTSNDKSPFVLTAKSCVGTAAEAQTVQAFWFYQTIACNSNTLQNGIFSSPTGAAILQSDTASDQTLLEILGVIPREVTFSGWNTQAQANGATVFTLHHPGSGFPVAENQLESYLRRASGTITAIGQSCSGTGLTNGYQATWTEGITEGGSAGAGLWTSIAGANVLVGVLSGCGESGCGQPANQQTDNFGRFSDFAPMIATNLAGGSDDAFEPNDTRPTARSVTSVNESNLVVKQGNEDWFQFSATPGQTISISAAFTHTFGDIDLELYRNSESTPVAVSDGVADQESITFVNSTGTNTFFLRVALFNDTRTTYTLTLNTGDCTYAINPTSQTIVPAGATGSVAVTPSSSVCAWTAVSNSSFITVTSGASGTGNGTVGYSVAANPGPERVGTVTIAGQTFTVTQANGCAYSINPTFNNTPAVGITGSVTVTASDAACPWTAVSNVPWVTITSGATGSGNGTVGYTVAPNTGPERVGTLTIAGLTFTVEQNPGCQYTLSATSFSVTWKGGRRSISVTTETGCLVFSTPNAPWITLVPPTPGQPVVLQIAPNAGPARTGTVMVAGQTVTVTQAARGASTPGQYRPENGFVYLRNSNDTGFANSEFFYGIANDIPISGDWDGDGIDTVGIYRDGRFFLRNANNTGFADLEFPFGTSGDLPVAGDWDGDGIDTVGIVRGNTVFLRNSNSTGDVDILFTYGTPTDTFIAGDWNGDGIDTIGAYRPTNGFVYLRNANSTGFADIEFFYGAANDRPVAGDWDGDGFDTIGIVRGNNWFLRNSNTTGFADVVFTYGVATDRPITGNWDGQ